MRGDRSTALDWLDRAYPERDPILMWVKIDPTMESLSDEPRFASAVVASPTLLSATCARYRQHARRSHFAVSQAKTSDARPRIARIYDQLLSSCGYTKSRTSTMLLIKFPGVTLRPDLLL
jgi:hypothetical protein